MAQTIYGDQQVRRTLTVDRRANLGLSREALVATRTVTLHDYQWLQITNVASQDVVLPDATTLANGWAINVMAGATSGASVNVKTYHAVTPVLLKNILVARAYCFTLVDNSTSAGVWQTNFLEEADAIMAARYVDTFNATSDWSGPAGGYYTRLVTAATHGMGTSPNVKTRSGTGPYLDVMVDSVSVATTGNVTISVPDTPDLRFAGQTVIA